MDDYDCGPADEYKKAVGRWQKARYRLKELAENCRPTAALEAALAQARSEERVLWQRRLIAVVDEYLNDGDWDKDTCVAIRESIRALTDPPTAAPDAEKMK